MTPISTTLFLGVIQELYSRDQNDAPGGLDVTHQYLSMIHVLNIQNSTAEARAQQLRHYKVIAHPDDAANECTWTDVVCDGQGLIRSITWNESNVELLCGINLRWLPHTLERVRIEDIFVVDRDPFQTRNLPKAAISVMFDSCRIPGTLDFTHLPSHLEFLSLRQNSLSGTVLFTELPQNMRIIDLRGNFISQVVVDNSALPKGFVKAHVSRRHAPMEVSGIEINEQPIDKRISLYHVNYSGTEVDQNDKPFVHIPYV